MTTQDQDTRDQLLDELKAAVEQWHTRKSDAIQKEADFLKSVLRGRTGSERLRRETVDRARILVLDDITSFLAGSS